MDNYSYDTTVSLTDLYNHYILSWPYMYPLSGGGFITAVSDLLTTRTLKAFVYNNDGTLNFSFTVRIASASADRFQRTSVVELSNGNLVIVYEYQVSSPANRIIYGKVFNSSGVEQVSETTLRDATGAYCTSPLIQLLPTGNIALINKLQNVSPSYYDGELQIFSPTFASGSGVITVYDHSITGDDLYTINGAALGGDKIFVSYARNINDQANLQYSLYHTSGNIQGSGSIINESASGVTLPILPDTIIKRTNGKNVVIWTQEHSGSVYTVRARHINTNGTFNGDAWTVSPESSDFRDAIGSCALYSDRFFIPYYDYAVGSTGEGKFYDENGNLNQTEDPMPTGNMYLYTGCGSLSNYDLGLVYRLANDYTSWRLQLWESLIPTFVAISGSTYTVDSSTLLGNVTVHCYRDSDGSFVDTQISDASGAYTFTFEQEIGETYTLVGDKAGHIVGAADNITPTVI